VNKQDRTEISDLNREVGELSVKVDTLEGTQGEVLAELRGLRSDISLAKATLRGAKFMGVVIVAIVGLSWDDLWMVFKS